MTGPIHKPQVSAWAPFGHSAFALLWTATVVSNIGTWMNDVGAGWLMTSLDPSPLMVALVQSATTLPVFLFALPAGAIADVIDRRRMLIFFQSLMAAFAAVFAVLVWRQWVNPPTLLVFTFLLGSCTAFISPVWQAVVPRLVPREALQPAVVLNNLGINISRAIGPAIAGFVIVGLGITAPFAINTVSFIGVIAALVWWRPPPAPRPNLPAEQFRAAMVTGLRYAASSWPLKATLIRSFAFYISASAFWALLPLIARQELSGGARLYGIMMAAIGAGAVAGAIVLPRVRSRLDPGMTAAAGTMVIMGVLLTAALVEVEAIVVPACFVFGAGWITVLSTLNVSAQIALPDWVKARGLAVYLTVFYGSLAAGSAIWGQVASLTSVPAALIIAAAALGIAIPLTWKAKLYLGEALDLTPAGHWATPIVAPDAGADARGPVMTTVEYRIARQDVPRFLAKIREFGKGRRRLGAFAWGVMEDAAEPGRFVEYFMEASWLQHLRHHERVSGADRALQEEIYALHQGPDRPKVTHLLAPEATDPTGGR